MAEKPSWCTSTLSQAFIGSLAFYCLMLLVVSCGVIWAGLNPDNAKLIVGWVSALQVSIASAYLVARKTNGEVKHDVPPAPPP